MGATFLSQVHNEKQAKKNCPWREPPLHQQFHWHLLPILPTLTRTQTTIFLSRVHNQKQSKKTGENLHQTSINSTYSQFYWIDLEDYKYDSVTDSQKASHPKSDDPGLNKSHSHWFRVSDNTGQSRPTGRGNMPFYICLLHFSKLLF